MQARPGGIWLTSASGRSMYVEDRPGGDGTQPPILFVHGFATNHSSWDDVTPELGKGRRIVVVDMPGFGFSARPQGDYSPTALAADLASVLDAVGVATADVVAHSWGSSLALALALDHPTRVRRLVLIGPWVFDEQLPPISRWARLPGVGEALFSAFYAERPNEQAEAAYSDGHRVAQSLVDRIEAGHRRPGAVRAALAGVRGQCYLQMEPHYPSIGHPTLVINGGEDRISRPRHGARLARSLADARQQVIEGVGHLPMIEAPATTGRLIVEFLERCPLARAWSGQAGSAPGGTPRPTAAPGRAAP